jgi:hypothetical protein
VEATQPLDVGNGFDVKDQDGGHGDGE